MAKTYSPKKVQVVVHGQLITGFADGTFIKVSKSADGFSMKVGADGEVARLASADESGTVEITLLQTSVANDILSQIHLADQLSQVGTGSLMIKDLNGTTLAEAPVCWVRKLADAENGNEVGARTWTLDASRLLMFVGGNI